MSKPNLHIILTGEGGNGHKAAAEAIKNMVIKQGDIAVVINTTKENWFNGLKYFTSKWNQAQANSNLRIQRLLTYLRKATILATPSFKRKLKKVLKNYKPLINIDSIIVHNTQPICLSGLVSAVADYNRKRDKKSPQPPIAKIINHLTDMPTESAAIPIEQIASLDPKDIKDANFELHTPKPIVSPRDFPDPAAHEAECHRQLAQLYPILYEDGFGKNRVKIVPGPIRAEFLTRLVTPVSSDEEFDLDINFTDKAEYDALNASFTTEDNPFAAAAFSDKKARIKIPQDVFVASVMLGSQASVEGMHNIVDLETELSKDSVQIKYLFVFCGPDIDINGKKSLYKQIREKAVKVNGDPNSKIKIIPLTNQPDSTIAPLYKRADQITTRSGGLSAMEIEEKAKKAKVILFTEASYTFSAQNSKKLARKFADQGRKDRLKELVAWEAGNAEHLECYCHDEKHRSRARLANIFTYGKELQFLKNTKIIYALIEQNNLTQAFELLSSDSNLIEYFMTGDEDVAYQLAELANIYHQLAITRSGIDKLLQDHPRLRSANVGIDAIKTSIEDMLKAKLSFTNLANVNTQQELTSLKDSLKPGLTSIQRALKQNIAEINHIRLYHDNAAINYLLEMLAALGNLIKKCFGLTPSAPPVLFLRRSLERLEKTGVSCQSDPDTSLPDRTIATPA